MCTMLHRVVLKLGPRDDMEGLLPKAAEGWVLCIAGLHFAVWEKGHLELAA